MSTQKEELRHCGSSSSLSQPNWELLSWMRFPKLGKNSPVLLLISHWEWKTREVLWPLARWLYLPETIYKGKGSWILSVMSTLNSYGNNPLIKEEPRWCITLSAQLHCIDSFYLDVHFHLFWSLIINSSKEIIFLYSSWSLWFT